MIGKQLAMIYTFFISNPLPQKCLCSSKKSPQKLFNNCLVDGILTSIA